MLVDLDKMYKLLKRFIFKINPEIAHKLSIVFLSIVKRVPILRKIFVKSLLVREPVLHQEIFDLNFVNPIGIAAGFDKDAQLNDAMSMLGFSYNEIGAVTLKPQEGNIKPRLARHIKEKTLQNAMGFNNGGIEKIKKNLLKDYPYSTPIGANIGKNKDTPSNNAIGEYLALIKEIESVVDFLTINISSPNTKNLRDLLNENFVEELFSRSKELTTKPLLLKLSPDLEVDSALKISDIALKCGCAGLIATNTTIDYSLIKEPKGFGGGLSGEVLKDKSYAMLKELANSFFSKTTIISVGGISSVNDVYDRLKAGASLVQIYTALIYEGPSLIKKINLDLIKLLKKDGYNSIKEIIGIECKR